ncbi:hypothetical protein [Amycolatopsis lexingtonensis]|uniref:hypothetical protein n=1 Tax=Amycolatopsis lexingtonensis TaxID=218822 RepID=UPI003F7097D4
MPSHLGTERLLLRPWAGPDAGDLRALHAERGRGTPALGEMRDLVAKMSAAATGSPCSRSNAVPKATSSAIAG